MSLSLFHFFGFLRIRIKDSNCGIVEPETAYEGCLDREEKHDHCGYDALGSDVSEYLSDMRPVFHDGYSLPSRFFLGNRR